jgi:chromosome partitioning protein
MGKPIIITIANQKGGVGKTTTVANVAASLADKGNLVLVIDCDYQANVTSLLCGDEQFKRKEKSFTHAIKNDLTLEKVVVSTQFKNLDIVPSNRELDDLREQLVGQPNQFRLVDFMLDCKQAKSYDYIIIDTHPSLDCFFQSAVTASRHYIIPLFPEADSSRGLAHQLQAIEKIKRYLNPALNFLGCVITKFDRYNATHQKFENLIRTFGKENKVPVFKNTIPSSHSIAAASAHGLPLFHYKKSSPAAMAYAKLAKEISSLAQVTGANKKKAAMRISEDLEIAAEL